MPVELMQNKEKLCKLTKVHEELKSKYVRHRIHVKNKNYINNQKWYEQLYVTWVNKHCLSEQNVYEWKMHEERAVMWENKNYMNN